MNSVAGRDELIALAAASRRATNAEGAILFILKANHAPRGAEMGWELLNHELVPRIPDLLRMVADDLEKMIAARIRKIKAQQKRKRQ